MLGSVELTEQKSPDGGSKLSSGRWEWNWKHRESQRHLITSQQTHHSCQHQDWLQISSVIWTRHTVNTLVRSLFQLQSHDALRPKTPTWWKKFGNFHTSHLRSARAAPGGRLMKTSDQLMIICGARSLLTLSHCSRSTLYSGINYSHTLVREEWKEEISHKSLNITESLNHINEDSWSINVLMKFLTSDVSVQLPQSCSNRRQCEWSNDTSHKDQTTLSRSVMMIFNTSQRNAAKNQDKQTIFNFILLGK